MRRRRWLALAAGAAALVLTPVMAGAAPLTSAQIYKPVGFFRFCAEAQLDTANIDEGAMASAPGGPITIGGTIYDDYNDFVNSKSSVDHTSRKILISQWTKYADAERTKPQVIRCKLRTAESLNEGAWPDDPEISANSTNGPRFQVDPYYGLGSDADAISPGTDSACSTVNQRTIDNVWANLTPEQQAASPFKPTDGTLTTVADTPTPGGVGPLWLLTNVPVLSKSPDNTTLRVASKSLYSPSTGTGPALFQAAYYCTFVAPQYLRDVLLDVNQLTTAG